MTTKQILGVKFFSGNALEAVDAGLRGGLVVVPSAPVLVGIADDPALLTGVLGADLAITDSGLMVLMWWLQTGEKLERVSGLEYLKLLLERLKQQQLSAASWSLSSPANLPTTGNRQPTTENASGVFWIMPTAAARDQNLAWLRAQGFRTTEADCYVAPKYGEGELHDETLLALILERKPAHIVIALGGGVQERLGWFIKQGLEKARAPGTPLFSAENPGYVPKPASIGAVSGIHCIGAAIGFLSGEQVRIPMWVDYLYLGWLWRSVSAPRKFLPRYWKATRLIGLMIRYRDKAPEPEVNAKTQGR